MRHPAQLGYEIGPLLDLLRRPVSRSARTAVAPRHAFELRARRRMQTRRPGGAGLIAQCQAFRRTPIRRTLWSGGETSPCGAHQGACQRLSRLRVSVRGNPRELACQTSYRAQIRKTRRLCGDVCGHRRSTRDRWNHSFRLSRSRTRARRDNVSSRRNGTPRLLGGVQLTARDVDSNLEAGVAPNAD